MDDYVFRKLHPSDPRILFLGDYDNCCERITDAANNLERTVVNTIHDEFHGYYAIEKKDGSKIVGHSWAYRGDGGSLIFDGFESNKQFFTARNLVALIQQICIEVSSNKMAPYHIDGIYMGLCAEHFGLERLGLHNTKTEDIVNPHYRKSGMTTNAFYEVLRPLGL